MCVCVCVLVPQLDVSIVHTRTVFVMCLRIHGVTRAFSVTTLFDILLPQDGWNT